MNAKVTSSTRGSGEPNKPLQKRGQPGSRPNGALTSRRVPLLWLVIGLGLIASIAAAEPVLHEYFDITEGNQAALSAKEASRGTASPNDSPAELSADDQDSVSNPNSAFGHPGDVQAGQPPSSGAGSFDEYRLDSNTSRPDTVGYEDPFTPTIPPFKRMYAYDSVNTEFELVVWDRQLHPLSIGGVAEAGDDQFFADMALDVEAGKPHRIPSVGPMARVLAARLEPAAGFSLGQDSAENWFITPHKSGRVRLIMHLSLDRRVFGSPFRDVDWNTLSAWVPDVPGPVRRRALTVLGELGVGREQGPRAALAALISHFRQFSPSEETPEAGDAGALYREIALSKKGVCRHRSYAFVVTAIGLGIPARFVRNEAHAWVEVFDGRIWHRVDLGGAAGEMQFSSDVEIAHTAPPDPYEWPANSESAEDMTESALSSGAQPGQGTSSSSSQTSGSDSDSARTPAEPARPASSATARPETTPSTDEPEPEATPEEEEPRTETLLENGPPSSILVEPHASDILQGTHLRVAGRVEGGNGPCSLLRVDVLLSSDQGTHQIGTLVTGENGSYAGEIALPRDIGVGEYWLSVETQGGPECGPGRSE